MEMRLLKERIRGVVLCVSLLMIVILSGCRGDGSKASASRGTGLANLPVKQIKVARAELRKLARYVTAPGTLAADEQATLSFKVAGRLSEIKVDLGSVVRKGQVIAQLETSDFKGRVNGALAGLQQARVRL